MGRENESLPLGTSAKEGNIYDNERPSVLPFSEVPTQGIVYLPAKGSNGGHQPAATSLNLMTMIKLVMRQKRKNNDPEIKHSDLLPPGGGSGGSGSASASEMHLANNSLPTVKVRSYSWVRQMGPTVYYLGKEPGAIQLMIVRVMISMISFFKFFAVYLTFCKHSQ